jgi:hypothetical protein
MSIESKIMSYLEAFGNTKESDLINYGVNNLGQSSGKVKKIIDRMAVKGKLHRVVHHKLKPPEVYVTLQEPLPPEAMVEGETTQEEITRILEEAASLADKISRNKPI